MSRPHATLHASTSPAPLRAGIDALFAGLVNLLTMPPQRPANVIAFPGVSLQPHWTQRQGFQVASPLVLGILITVLVALLFLVIL